MLSADPSNKVSVQHAVSGLLGTVLATIGICFLKSVLPLLPSL